MKILTENDSNLKTTAVCIGKFDGLHRGHRSLFLEAKKSALPLVMFTFLFPGYRGIYSNGERQKLAEEIGADYYLAIPLAGAFRQMSGMEFAEKILSERLGAKLVVVGEDFRFGYKRQGDASLLEEAGKKFGFSVRVMEKIRSGGEIVSSTRIRELLRTGKIEEANELLQTPYFFCGKVEQGNRIGRRISVPTANIRPSANKELPPAGVYAVRVRVGDSLFDGVCNLGVKPTVSKENQMGLEVWLFDYSGDLYGRDLTVFFYAFLRHERTFENVEKLREQILVDTERAKKRLSIGEGND